MPRPKAPESIPDIPQHITQRGNNRQVCFYADEELPGLPGVTGLGLPYFELRHRSLHAYCLMTNHSHLLMTPSTPKVCPWVIQDLS